MSLRLSKTSALIPFILVILQVAAFAEMDLFVPSLPQMMYDFETTESVISWVLSLNFFGFFVSALFCGPLADAYGRRRILIAGSALFALGGLVSVVAPSIELFLFARFIQGVGVSAPVVLGIAIIGDLYQGERQVRLLSTINSIISITMSSAPLLGAVITSHLGWRANFGAIAILAFVGLFLAVALVPETMPEEHKRDFKVQDLVVNYKRLLFSKEFMIPTLGLCLMVTPYFVFVGMASLLFIDEMGVPMNQYVYYQGSVAGMFAFCSLMVPTLSKRVNLQKWTYASAFVTLAAALLLTLQGALFVDRPLPISVLMGIYCAGLVLPVTVLFVRAMEVFADLRGSASALAQSIRMLSMGLGSAIAGWTYNGTYAPLGWQTGIAVTVACLMILPILKASAANTETLAAAPH
jgi:DHA1 family bicyclomycin/chloramphenicol resistance-like MFS transporter